MKAKILRLMGMLNIDNILRAFNKQPRILFWHGVDNKIDYKIETEIFDVELFKKQIKYMSPV